jgi:hypothetical protein
LRGVDRRADRGGGQKENYRNGQSDQNFSFFVCCCGRCFVLFVCFVLLFLLLVLSLCFCCAAATAAGGRRRHRAYLFISVGGVGAAESMKEQVALVQAQLRTPLQKNAHTLKKVEKEG